MNMLKKFLKDKTKFIPKLKIEVFLSLEKYKMLFPRIFFIKITNSDECDNVQESSACDYMREET